MELIRYNESIHSEVSIDKVVKKGIRKIYFVYEGRNAWWSTWVHTYKPGCMHTTLDSAQQYVEKNRKRGSVFYIEEIPALTLEGKFISLIISQINCQEVLENYKSKHKNPIKGLNTCHITTGASLYQAYKSFAFDSLFWYVPPPKENSVLIFASKYKLKDLETYRIPTIYKHKSESVGSNYLLRWKASAVEARSNALSKAVMARQTRRCD
jgi:hypothetical protein